MKQVNKKGFTLIELLAVIVILGVIMLIAIPSINAVLTSARKSSFASTAKQYINAARNLALAGDVQIYADPSLATVVSLGAIELENNPNPMRAQSPFGVVWQMNDTSTSAYVVIRNTRTAADPRYTYYFAGTDLSGNCIPLTEENSIDQDDVSNGCSITSITSSVTTLKIGESTVNLTYTPTGESEAVSTVVYQ